MPRLLAFDLDGTLIQSEGLKAESYAWAANQLRPGINRAAVETAYSHLVGHSREEITRSLLATFDLAPEARAYDPHEAPWRTYVGLRLECYRAMLGDGDLVRRSTWTHAAALLEQARDLADHVALVTTSERWAATAVLDALDWHGHFDAIVTADDVPKVKPDPAGYRLALERLSVAPERALTIEDSPSGLRAALAAGIRPLAVPTHHTRARVGAMVESGELAADAVTEPEALEEAARQRLRA
ncbi:MAG: HAD family phosphatase [Bacteroidota bacterium]